MFLTCSPESIFLVRCHPQLAIRMAVHQSSDCSTPSAGKITAIFYLQIFAQRHC